MKKMIIEQLTTVVAIVVILTLALNYMLEIWNIERTANNESSKLFLQVEQILERNNEELEIIEAEHRQQCIDNATSVAYILSHTPHIMEDTDELKKIAALLNVDEIHIFNAEGEIVKGSEPKYYGLTFDSGEQVKFFKPMLSDKTLTLCQDITPNTAESKMMQYAATWNDDGTMIVQIGMEPIHVIELTKKNELSYIFSLLTTDDDSELYAADCASGEILGSTDTSSVGLSLSDLGLNMDSIYTNEDGFHATINGASTYCVFTEYGSILIGRAYPSSTLYEVATDHTLGTGCYLLAITAFMVTAITLYMSKNIVHGIADVNSKLAEITKGNFEATVNVNSTPEFSELSAHINTMVTSILNTTDKISYILDKANLPICVYEYSAKLTHVRATHQIPQILALNKEQAETLLADHNTFEAYLEQLKECALESDPSIYKLPNENERYIKMESFQKDDSIMGFILDATDEVQKRQRIERERDIDLLTQLYNRRALEHKLDILFEHPDSIKHGAMIMLDSDGLKVINDKYGHKAGDRYLCETANLLKTLEAPNKILARQGGDEFVIFIYGCETDEELMRYISSLADLREKTYFKVDDTTSLPLNYSFGYSKYKTDSDDFITLLREADVHMYAEKRQRKGNK